MNLPRVTFLSFALLGLPLGLGATPAAEAPHRVVITKLDELPRLAYPATLPLEQLIADDDAFAAFARTLRADLEARLRDFDIRDVPTVKGYLNALRLIDMLEGRDAEALSRIREIRALEEKPSDKLTSGLIPEAIIEARAGQSAKPEATLKDFARRYAAKLAALPYATVEDELQSLSGSLQVASRNLYLGRIRESLQPAVDKSGVVSLDNAIAVVGLRYSLQETLPRRDAIVAELQQVITANKREKADIWAARAVDLSDAKNLTPVVVAIWDSGVDTAIFGPLNQLWTNPAEQPNGIDDDKNGFVDDIHGIAFDVTNHRTPGNLLPLTAEQQTAYPALLKQTKGLLDLQAAVDSEEAQTVRGAMARLQPEDYKPFVENLGLTGNYIHGTHVAGIAAAGNPAVRLLSCRITFDHRLIPPAPPIEESLRGAWATRDAVAYFRQQGVRVVNMSWGGDQAGIEAVLEANGVGDSPEMRAELARLHFRLGYDALVKAMREAPEILFIPAAGNSDNDVQFTEDIPASIDLPNVLVVGAVDQAGEETGFTSFGKNVRTHANGFEVDSYVPGGSRLQLSGTSMAAPNVANLAAKLIALDPGLKPEEVIALIRLGCDTSADGRRILLNPRKSVDLLRVRQAKP